MCRRIPKIIFARESTSAGVTFASSRRAHVDAGEEEGQVRGGEFKTGLSRSAIVTSRGIEFLKSAGLESLVPDDQTVSLPEEDLDAIATTIEKKEQVTRERVLAKILAGHPHEPIEAFSHVSRFYTQENADRGGELREHQWAPWRERLSRPAAVIAA
jgi:hypothetical protein